MAFIEGPASARTAEPTGTVTFLFSDIEGSTQRWEFNRSAMADALARHDAAVRGAIESHRGHVFKTLGDAFCAAFSTASDAAAAAVDAQRAVAVVDAAFASLGGLRVRIALLTGTAVERDGDYFGPSLNRVARLLATGHGGQILVSGATAQLLEADLPAHDALIDLGVHRLKDLAHPEHVYQLVAPDLARAFPPLRSLDAFGNNLPARITSFVGRDEDIAAIEILLKAQRLVTLSGAGGVGKSRCAVQAGADVLESFADGVWLVELARISDGSLVANSIAQALNVRDSPNATALDTLLAYLRDKDVLLILDNCEHVVDDVRRVVTEVLERSAHVRLLCTSREALNVEGEALYRMPSLPMPAAVQLFSDRARAVESRFELTHENAQDVEEICRRLDGIPLAIELAAARVNILTPHDLAQRLDRRFPLLTRGSRTALPRQQTMWALIDWSYELLSDEERAFFRKLSVFSGGFTLAAAGALHNGDEMAALDLLASLVDKSLVQADTANGMTRYRLLESTQEYARTRLSDAGETEAAERAHGEYFLALAESLDAENETMSDLEWITRAEPEFENWRSALEWSLGKARDVLLGQRLVAAIRWGRASYSASVARRWIAAAEERITGATPAAAIAKLAVAESHVDAVLMLPKASLDAAQRAIALYEQLGTDRSGLADAEFSAGRASFFLNRLPESEALLQRSLSNEDSARAKRRTAFTYQFLGHARASAGDADAARSYFQKALAIARSIGTNSLAMQMVSNLAELEFRQGNVQAALDLSTESIASLRASGQTRNLLMTLSNIVAYLVVAKRYDDARNYVREALATRRDTIPGVVLAACLQHVAAIAALGLHDAARAAHLLGFVDALLTRLEVPREYTEQQEYDEVRSALRKALREDELSRQLAEGAAWSEEDALKQAMLV